MKRYFENGKAGSKKFWSIALKNKTLINGEYVLYLASTVYDELYDSDIASDGHIKSFKAKTTPSGAEWKEGDSKILQKLNPFLFAMFESKWQRGRR